MKFLSAIATIAFFFSCTSRPVEPTRSSRHAVDTLFQRQVILLQPQMDSICRLKHKEVYTAAVDSIMEVRKTEMNLLVE